MIADNTLELLINPYNSEVLTQDGNGNLIDKSGNQIPIVNGIPNFLALEKTEGLNKTRISMIRSAD